MKVILSVVVFASIICIQQVSSQSLGVCLKSPVIKDFNASRYLGKWYEIKRFNYIFEPQNLQCLVAIYGSLNQTAISVNNTGFNVKTKKTDGRSGYAYVPNAAEPNKLSVVLPVEVFNVTILQGEGPYDVLETDYDTYALVYSCTQ
ncbi:apolipo D-like, partial [Brachionus plicatilis]